MKHTQVSVNRQTSIYTKKCFRIFFNEKGWKIFISAAIITLLISSVTSADMFVGYFDTRSGAFALVCACIWIGIFNSIQSICKERDIIKREYCAGVSMRAYMTAHVIFEAALCAVEAIIVTLIVLITNSETVMPDGVALPSCVELLITFFLIVFAADALALLVSSIVKTPNTAMTVMPFVLIIQLVMSGFIFTLEGPAERIADFTISKWGLNAICAIAGVNSMQGGTSQAAYDSTIENLTFCWGIMLLFVLVYACLATVSLTFVDRDKR